MYTDASFWAFALLIAALLVFIVSTRQWPLGRRALVWGLGLALLAGSLYLNTKLGPHDGFVRTALDSLRFGKDSLLVEVVEGNRGFVGGYVAPMLDTLLVFGALAALFALVAFTPGGAIERLTQTLCIAALGATAGGLIALVVVAFGFGGYPKRTVFFSTMQADGAIDGDTIRMGDISMRLAGIDAPEYAGLNEDGSTSIDDQICFSGTEPVRCGNEARSALRRLIEGRTVVCKRLFKGGKTANDLYGRPLVTCTARVSEHSWLALGWELARAGYVIASEGGPDLFGPEIAEAKEKGAGIWSYCSLKPSVWRNNVVARRKFLESNGKVWDADDIIAGARCTR